MRELNAESLPDAIAACSAGMIDTHKEIATIAMSYLKDELVNHPIPMGNAAATERHIHRAQQRVKYRTLHYRDDPACGFGLLGFLTILNVLFQVWKLFAAWRDDT